MTEDEMVGWHHQLNGHHLFSYLSLPLERRFLKGKKQILIIFVYVSAFHTWGTVYNHLWTD